MVQTLKMDLWAFALEFSASGKPMWWWLVQFCFCINGGRLLLGIEIFQSPATTMRAAMVYTMSFAATLWHVRISGLGSCYSWQTCFRISMGWLHVLNIDVWSPNDPNEFLDMGLFRNGAPKFSWSTIDFPNFLWDKAIWSASSWFIWPIFTSEVWSMKLSCILWDHLT